MKFFRKISEIDKSKYILVDYLVASEKPATVRDVAWGIAIGQSVGNPNVRNEWETDDLFEKHSCVIIGDEDKLNTSYRAKVRIAFPVANIDINTDGITQLLVMLMGGQLDIDIVKKCRIIKIIFPKNITKAFKGPKYGIKGVRDFVGSYDKPLLGGIVKPKTGITPEILLEMVKQLVEGGVDFIKEDEIMSNPAVCPIEKRVPLVMDYLKDKNVIYAVCINADAPYLLERVKQVYELGGNAVHVNFWAGLGCYKAIRDMDLPLFLFFQKSGDKILTDVKHRYSISWNVICQLAGMSGVDFIHAGMWGGYLDTDENNLIKTLNVLNRYGVVPSLSCGMHAGLIAAINKRFGVDYMANVGGAIHGHPAGSKAGAIALRQAIDKTYGEEYYQSVAKWGEID